MIWPKDTREEMDSFYGRHRLGADGMPTSAWESEHLTRIILPYPLTLSWDLSVEISKLRCHKKVAESLSHIFEQILAHYGSIPEIKTLSQICRLHLMCSLPSHRFRIESISYRR